MKIYLLIALQIVVLLYFGSQTITDTFDNPDEVKEQFVQNIKIKESLFTNNPLDFDLAMEVGDDFINSGNYKKAEHYFLEAKKIDPKNIDSYTKLGFLYRYQGLMEKSETEYKNAVNLDPKNDSVYIELGKLYRNWEKYQEAIVAFKEAVKIDPRNDSAYGYGLGFLYRDMGDLVTAEKYFLKAFEINKSEFNYGALGDIYRDQKRYKEAEIMFKKAIEINPDGENYGGLGWVYMQEERFKAAEDMFRKYLEKVRPKGEMYYALAQSLFGQKRYKEAEVEMRKAFRLNHNTPDFYDYMEKIFLEQGKSDMAWAVTVRKSFALKNHDLSP